jgi:ABC-type transport system substrate-binding protein
MRPVLFFPLVLFLSACSGPVNNPYPTAESTKSIFYSGFTEPPKHLDPARSYASNEAPFTGSIYEPPLQYQYLKRPYQVVPLTATALPTARYFDASGLELPATAATPAIAESVYEIHIHPGIQFQPHPAFARNQSGQLAYIPMPADVLDKVRDIPDFPLQNSRELTADDYVYEIKRLASPRLQSPIAGLMANYILGFDTLSKTLAVTDKSKKGWLDLRQFTLAGAEVVDRYTYRVRIKGKYPQFIYWLAMPFFAPVPWEVDDFYSQPGMADRNLTLDNWPVGTGPYLMTMNQPNRQMRLVRNPNFRGEAYPSEGEPGDAAAGLLKDAGKPMPFIDQAVYSLESETIPYWNKFLQGYYDASGISSDNFDQAVRTGTGGSDVELTPEMVKKGIRLSTSVAASSYYMGFNMLDPVLGGLDSRHQKLRQAISIVVDEEEYIAIFANGRGIPAQGPIPPGLFGYRDGQEGLNPVIYDWIDGKTHRKSIETARQLLAEAGYPDGRDAITGKPLTLNFDTASHGPDDKARLDWFRKQFRKLNIELVIRGTDYNRFQDKMRDGTEQIFEWGWNADYPDPENFLFLLYGPNKKVGSGGENAANYQNPEFDQLFTRMKDMNNGPERQAIIDQMVRIVRQDAPWSFGFHPKDYGLRHSWVKNSKPNLMANNGLKYLRIDAVARETARTRWNHPDWFGPILTMLFLTLTLVPAWRAYRRKQELDAR